MLNEEAKRKDCFDEPNSVWVVLADGQRWAVPKPWYEVRPTFRGGRAVGSYPAYTYGPETDALIEILADTESLIDEVSAVASLAAYLLLKQYDLTDGELDQILAYRSTDPASLDWTKTVIRVATGRSGPKVLTAGGD